ncbi:ATP-binding protein [Streptomyces virginiae]|uniref:ATP-binding protein n=1 Tax=Streptomyces virginiae TaxID=1961 RepID=UPI00365B148E
MGTATAPSATQPTKASTHQPRTDQPSGRPPQRPVDTTCISFSTTPYAGRADLTAKDLRRVREVRQTVKQRLILCGLPDLVDDMALVVSELVTNAIQHNPRGAEVSFLMELRDGLLLVVVSDGTPTARRAQHAGDGAEHGRGLDIVQAVAEEHHGSWGATSDRTGTWCELPVRTLRSAA